MADLVEVDTFEVGIYQLETTDPVEGGPGGIDNRQAQQLANRTKFLKSMQDAHAAAADPHPQYMTTAESDAAIAEAVAALVASSPAALDTLAEFATALGNDPDFATTIINLLAAKAAIDSPVFTGTPSGPTPEQFDVSTKFATMEALKRGAGNFRGVVTYNADTVLDATHIGKVVSTNTLGVVFTLPAANSVSAGEAITFRCGVASLSGYTINAVGANIIGTGRDTNTTSINPKTWDTFTLTSDGNNTWFVSTGYISDVSFLASRSANGYQQLPSGLIIQWGSSTTSGTAGTAVTFPIAFPTACAIVTGSHGGTSELDYGVTCTDRTQTGFLLNVWNSAGASQSSISGEWFAIGY